MNARFTALLTLLIFTLGVGTVGFHTLEDWTWIQSFYFTVVTLTTVGYGDLHPTSDSSRLFTSLFILVGVAIVVSALSVLGTAYVNRHVNRRQARRKR